MVDNKKTQDEIVEEIVQEEQSRAYQAYQSSGTHDYKVDRDEVLNSSQQFFRSLFRAGVHLAMAPAFVLPDEPREHFFNAGREFTRGLSSLAQEIANDFDKLVSKANEDLGE